VEEGGGPDWVVRKMGGHGKRVEKRTQLEAREERDRE